MICEPYLEDGSNAADLLALSPTEFLLAYDVYNYSGETGSEPRNTVLCRRIRVEKLPGGP